MLRPGGFFVWSATPVYQKIPEDVEIWKGIEFHCPIFGSCVRSLLCLTAAAFCVDFLQLWLN